LKNNNVFFLYQSIDHKLYAFENEFMRNWSRNHNIIIHEWIRHSMLFNFCYKKFF